MSELKHCRVCPECLEMISGMALAFQKYLEQQDRYLKANIDNLRVIVNAAEKLYQENSELNRKIFIEFSNVLVKYYELGNAQEEAQS